MADIKCILLGGSAGSGEFLESLWKSLKPPLSHPLICCRHIQNRKTLDSPVFHLQDHYGLPFREPEDKEPIERDAIYLAPPGYHLLLEETGAFALSMAPRVHFCRPSVDVLFQSAARCLGSAAMAVLLSGANEDGAQGLADLYHSGVSTLVQNPEEAAFPIMPEAALKLCPEHMRCSTAEIIERIIQLVKGV